MRKIVFDLESNGLLYEADTIWCLCLSDLESDDQRDFLDIEILEGIELLRNAELIIGHNICGFDLPLIEKIYGIRLPLDRCRDTYVISKMLYPTRKSHSLESYGNSIGIEKIQHEDWSHLSDEMLERCRTDVQMNERVYISMLPALKKHKWLPSILIENEMHYWQAQQELEGLDIDETLAVDLLNNIDNEIEEIDAKLLEILPLRARQVGTSIMKPFKRNGTYCKRVLDWWNVKEEEESNSEQTR